MRREHRVLRWLAAGAGIAVFATLLAAADPVRVFDQVRGAGPRIALATLPFLGAITADAIGWLLLIRVLGARPRLVDLMRVRISLEALLMTFPGGSVISESSAPSLLSSWAGLPIGDAVVAVAARRWITLRSNAIYLAAGAVTGFGVLQVASVRVLHRAGLGVLALLLPLVPLSISIALEATLSRGSFARSLHRALSKLPGRAGRWFAVRGESFANVDNEFQRFEKSAHSAWAATAAFTVAWTMESVETWSILALLGARVPFFTVLAFEPALALLRSAVFFVPAGLGAQDAGYLAFLGGGPTAFAFIAVKRMKELFWAAIGWALLLTSRSSKSEEPVSDSAEVCA
jgi:hypothetical protein